jgi:hypothetical protein
MSKIIRGVRPMTLDQLAVICEALGQDLGELIAEVQAFLVDTASSPLNFVQEGERLDEPFRLPKSMLDRWGDAAATRVDEAVQAGTRVRSGIIMVEPGYSFLDQLKSGSHEQVQ